jgi:hypothetical protein
MATRDLNTNADGNNTGARQGPFGAGHALSMNRSTPDAPSGQRGQGNAYNVVLVDSMTIQVAGPSGAASVRGRIWDSSGTAYARSGVVTAPSSTSFSIGNVTMPLTSSVILYGGTIYRWGVWSTADIRVQTSSNSSFNVYTDTSIGASDNWSTGNTLHSAGTNFSLVGFFNYYLIPTAPSVFSGGSTTSSISFSWSVSDNGGKSISAYQVQYKPNFSGTWITYDGNYTSTSATISGLSSSTTYDVRVSAINEVATLAGTTSEFGYASVTTDTATSTFSFSPAPATVTVPSLTDLTLTQANTALSNAGLASSATAQPVGATSGNNNLVVSGTQSPGAGSVVNVGSTVSFQYYSYTPPAQEVSVWNGTSWVTSTPRIWNGTSWVDPAVIRVWNGTSWVNPT